MLFESGAFFLERSVAHARGGADGRQEGCERGYYHLHRQLDDLLFLHTIFRFYSVVRGCPFVFSVVWGCPFVFSVVRGAGDSLF